MRSLDACFEGGSLCDHTERGSVGSARYAQTILSQYVGEEDGQPMEMGEVSVVTQQYGTRAMTHQKTHHVDAVSIAHRHGQFPLLAAGVRGKG